VEAAIAPGGTLLAVIADLPALLRAKGRSRKSGKRVVTSGGPYLAGDLAFLSALAEAGELRAVVDRTYLLGEIVDAHRFVATGRKRGAVVVSIRSEP
jgi:NADPH:quinone reductase-like Zn-dependent oxidoreductase